MAMSIKPSGRHDFMDAFETFLDNDRQLATRFSDLQKLLENNNVKVQETWDEVGERHIIIGSDKESQLYLVMCSYYRAQPHICATLRTKVAKSKTGIVVEKFSKPEPERLSAYYKKALQIAEGFARGHGFSYLIVKDLGEVNPSKLGAYKDSKRQG